MNPLKAFRLDGKVVVLTGGSSGLGVGFDAELDPALPFLASPASSYLTSTTLFVDGGMTAL